MKNISEHCSDLSKLVSGYEPDVEWPRLCEWLHIASGIVNVQFDVIRFDTCFGWCSDADEFSCSREEILEKYITELTRFTYVWSALESLINDINPEESPERGKINSICYYMKNRLAPCHIIYPYLSLMEELQIILSKSGVDEQEIFKRFKGTLHLSEHGLGIYVIYKLRNLFLHGSLNFPYPDEENQPKSLYPKLVSLSTRITLLSIQMILLAFYISSDIATICHWESDKDDNFYPVKEVVKNIHLEKKIENHSN